MHRTPDLAFSIATTLRRAHGWTELGCYKEALEELNELPDVLHCSRDVLKLKCNILCASQNWAELRSLSATSARYFPTESLFAEDWAWAEYKQGRAMDAYSILLQASEAFPATTWRTAYFLACFAHSLKRMQEAAQWLGHAFLLHSSPAQLKEQAQREQQFRS